MVLIGIDPYPGPKNKSPTGKHFLQGICRCSLNPTLGFQESTTPNRHAIYGAGNISELNGEQNISKPLPYPITALTSVFSTSMDNWQNLR